MGNVHYSPDYEMADRANVAGLLDRESHNYNSKEAKEWVRVFMVKYSAWFTDLEKDWWQVLRAIPAGKLEDLDELKKFLVVYFKTRLAKPDKPGKTIKMKDLPSQGKFTPEIKEIKIRPMVIIPEEAQTIIKSAESKTHAMYLLNDVGYDNVKIAEFMNTNAGLVGNGINMYKKKLKKK